MQDATINGDVIAEAGGGVWCLDSYIAGDVEANHATFMMLWWCTVDGYVDARGQGGDEYDVVLRFSTVGGDVTIKQNEAVYMSLEENSIGGNVRVIGNYSVDAENFGIFVVNNYIAGKLTCKANQPAAEVWGNTVAGHVNVDD